MKFFKKPKYLKDEGGAISAFVMVLFLTMVVGGGMGIDFMNHESERAALQDALDRGVLASASFEVSDYEGTTEEERDLYITERVTSYLRSNDLLVRHIPSVVVDSDVNQFSRRVSVSGNYEIDTFFLKIIGINTLNVGGMASAETSRGKVEISIILDNSGSMRGSKMTALQNAANNFIDLMLNTETIPHTSISLVPFAAQVNAGANLASRYNLQAWHGYSYCFEFGSSTYNSTALSTTASFQQEQNYYRGENGTHECPSATILPFSNNPTALHAAINGMSAGGYTATYAGMKWGAALLDPDSDTIVTQMISDGLVDSRMAGRPVAWNDELGTKFIILMTDGANTQHKRIRTSYYRRNGTPHWRSQANADYWNNRSCSGNNCSTENVVNSGTGDSRLQAICNAAKADIPGTTRDRITVFTIGFEVSNGSNPYNMMRQCASSFSKFYHVGSSDLDAAFTQIASSINKLRLTN